LLALVVAMPWPGGALAAGASFRQDVGEFRVYLAVMPAEFLAGPGVSQVPGATPYDSPAARDTHHVMVSIFERRSGRRVSDAAVQARVAALGFSGEKKTLRPRSVADEQVYAALFPMIGRGPFRVDVEFRPAEAARAERARFYFSHPSFAPPAASRRERRPPQEAR
jgi:hypothetical protein